MLSPDVPSPGIVALSNLSQSKNSASKGRIRVLLVDDHPAIRDAVAGSVQKKMDLELVGTAEAAEEALELIRQTPTDVAIVDLSLPDAHGLDLVQNLVVQFPDLRVIVFSMYDEDVYAERAVRAGAKGYVMKSESTQAVIDAIRTVHDGEVYLSRKMTSRILNRMVSGEDRSEQARFAIDELTDRELTVFQMLGEGVSIEDISDRLSLSRKTVETYRRRAKEKLGFDTVSELLQFAVRWAHGQGIPNPHDDPR